MQRGAGKMRDQRLKGIETIVQRQQRISSESDDHRLAGLAENGRARFLRTGLGVLDRLTLAPLRDRLSVEPKFPG